MEVVTESGLEVGEGTGVKLLNSGVFIASVTEGDEKPEGVEAWSVANKGSVGGAEGASRLHPRITKKAAEIQSRLFFIIV